MRGLLIVPALILAAGCSSAGNGGGAPAPVTPAEKRVAELQTSMTELLERLDVMNDRMARLEAQLENVETRAAAPSGTRRVERPVTPPPPAAAADAAPPQRAVAGAQIAEKYRNAMVLYGTNRAAEARTAFQAVYDADPSGELADNALYWIGETYYSARDFGNAVSFFRRVTEEYPEQNKAPDALYKLALAYEKTGDLALARKTLQEVVSRYPYSTQASGAKGDLDRIKY